MNKQAIQQLATRLITEGRMREALKAISDYVAGIDSYISNDMIMQTARFNSNETDNGRGVINRDDYSRTKAQIRYALTQIMERLPENGNGVEAPSDVASGPPPPPLPSKRKILFLSANPKGTGRLSLDKELKLIKERLASSTQRDTFDLEIEMAVEISTITGAMQKQKPEIVHFSGHGSGVDGIAVENREGAMILFPTKGLSRLFRAFKDTVKCVVLNACYASEQAKVISQHGIYVIGMNDAVEDEAAIDFAQGFYQSLGEGGNFEFAFDMALVNNSANINDADTPELWLNGEKLEV